jgi:hypothetical protein
MYETFPSYRAALDREGVVSGADLIVAGTPDDMASSSGDGNTSPLSWG